MVSDFVQEYGGFLRLSDMELALARKSDPEFSSEAREIFEYSAGKEGYWTSARFMAQIEKAVKIAEQKYNSTMYTLVWLFDQSNCHRGFAQMQIA